MKILLVGAQPNVEKFAGHLAQYGEVEWVYPEKMGEVPYGTAWVICMNSGRTPGSVFAAAGRVGAKCIHIPAAWSHAQEKLEAVGFFKAAARAKGEIPGKGEEARQSPSLTQRPFAGIADALAERQRREREENERKAREATERGMNPPPVEETPEEEFTDEPTPETAEAPAEPALTAREDVPVEVPDVKDDEGRHVFTADDRALGHLTKRVLAEGKEERLRQIFRWNPDLAITDAQAMLAAVTHDGRALNWTRMSEIRDAVREAKGLPVGTRHRAKLRPLTLRSVTAPAAPAPAVDDAHEVAHPRYTQGCPPCEDRYLAGGPGPLPQKAPQAAAAPAPAPIPPVPAPQPPPTAAPAQGGVALPAEVADAARLLGEVLASHGIVGAFSLTWQKGDAKPRVKWRPDLGETDADL